VSPPIILLTGFPGCGKTTLIKRVVQRLGHLRLAGFYTQELLGANGRRVGFEAIGSNGKSATLAHISSKSKVRVGRYGVALALLLLLRIPDVDLVGLTTVYGCTDIRAKVAKKILQAACRPVPVVAGLGVPFKSPMPVWHTGTEGNGLLSVEERTASLESMGIAEGAEDFIIEAVQEYGMT